MTHSFAAAIFDLDGVVTFTARVHAAAWKELFDEFLRSVTGSDSFRPFDAEDYRLYIDGRLRYDGVQTFLTSRGLSLPYGDPSDPPAALTVCGLGNRKDLMFRAKVQQMGVEVDTEATRLIRDLRKTGVRVGVASSSKNTSFVLESSNLSDLFEAQVDGTVSEDLGLRSKPSPDIFLHCLARLGVQDPIRAIVFEDAVAGVEAGRNGGFGLVVGVDRGGNKSNLLVSGADMVIDDFATLSVDRLESIYLAFYSRRQARAS